MWRLITRMTRKLQAERARALELARRRQRFEHNAAIQRVLNQAR